MAFERRRKLSINQTLKGRKRNAKKNPLYKLRGNFIKVSDVEQCREIEREQERNEIRD